MKQNSMTGSTRPAKVFTRSQTAGYAASRALYRALIETDNALTALDVGVASKNKKVAALRDALAGHRRQVEDLLNRAEDLRRG